MLFSLLISQAKVTGTTRPALRRRLVSSWLFGASRCGLNVWARVAMARPIRMHFRARVPVSGDLASKYTQLKCLNVAIRLAMPPNPYDQLALFGCARDWMGWGLPVTVVQARLACLSARGSGMIACLTLFAKTTRCVRKNYHALWCAKR